MARSPGPRSTRPSARLDARRQAGVRSQRLAERVHELPLDAAPLLIVGSRGDSLIGHAAVGVIVRHARHARAVLVPGGDHGWDLLQGPAASARIRAAIVAFLAHAGAPVATGCPGR